MNNVTQFFLTVASISIFLTCVVIVVVIFTMAASPIPPCDSTHVLRVILGTQFCANR